MGTTGAVGMAEAVQDDLVSLERALAWHLQSNHYPPVPLVMIVPCIAAIEAANEDDYERDIDLPEEVSYKGHSHAPAWKIIEAHHLDAFISEGDI